MSRVYAGVNQEMPRSYWDYLSADISWGLLEDYEVVRRIGEFRFRIGNLQLISRSLYTKWVILLPVGRGRLSDVFEGVNVTNYQKCIIKVPKLVEKRVIKREVKILQNLSGGPNILPLLDVVRGSQVSSTFFCAYSSVTYYRLYEFSGLCLGTDCRWRLWCSNADWNRSRYRVEHRHWYSSTWMVRTSEHSSRGSMTMMFGTIFSNC